MLAVKVKRCDTATSKHMLTTLTKQPSLLHRRRPTPLQRGRKTASLFFSETARHVNPGSTTCAWKKKGSTLCKRRRRALVLPTSETGQGHVLIAQVSFHGGNPVPSKRGGGGTYMAARKAPQRSGRAPPAPRVFAGAAREPGRARDRD